MAEGGPILERVKVLTSMLRQDSASDIADRLEAIVSDRDIWDKMVIRLSSELNSLLAAKAIPNNEMSIAHELLVSLNPGYLGAFQESVYGPMRALAAEIGASGFPGWETRLNDAISNGFTSTEIFMALRWTLDQMLISASPLPVRLRESVAQFRDKLDKALQVR